MAIYEVNISFRYIVNKHVSVSFSIPLPGATTGLDKTAEGIRNLVKQNQRKREDFPPYKAHDRSFEKKCRFLAENRI